MQDHPTTARFADYATSGAFQVGLTRGQIATLVQVADGDHNPVPHMGTIGALERKGLVRIIEGDGRYATAQVRPTAAGALVAQLCAMAGLTNTAVADLAVQLERLTDDLAEARAKLAAMADDSWTLRARMEAAESARDALQAEKDGRGFAKPLITLKDRQPGKPIEAMEFTTFPLPQGPKTEPATNNGFCRHCAQPHGHPHMMDCPDD